LRNEDIQKIVEQSVLEARGPYEVPLDSRRILPLDAFVYPDHVIGKIMLVKDRIENPEKYIDMRLDPGQAILLQGEHGTGKSTLPLSIAKACEAKVFQIDSRIIRGIVGETEHEIRRIFYDASCSRRTIVLIDEVHQLIPISQRTEEFTQRTFHTLSTEIENGIREGITVIATSSINEDIPYFSRLLEVIKLPLPSTPEERLQILLRNAEAYGFKTDQASLKEYADDKYTSGWSGKKLVEMLRQAASFALRDGKREIDNASLAEAYLSVKEARENV
jgi:SpoVK/Ycf46/Vps4 family AAA+-type ATPase